MLAVILKLLPRSVRTARYLRALERGRLATAERYMTAGLDWQAALAPTVRLGSTAMLRRLLLLGANPARPSGQSLPPILMARRSSIDPPGKIQALLDAGARPDAAVGKFSLLNYAIMTHDSLLLEALIKNGANLRDRDSSGLAPFEMANAVENGLASDALRAAGIENRKPTLRDFESVFVNPVPFFSQVHELVKWSIRNAGFEPEDVTAPKSRGDQDFRLRYRLVSGLVKLRIELEFLSGSEIALLLFDQEAAAPLCSLIPSGTETLDSARLRGYVVTVLAGIRKTGKFAPSEEIRLELTPAVRAALDTLGLSPSSTSQQIIGAYRSLAKRYHPDLGSGSPGEMVRINRAYETLTKKR